MPYVGFQGPYVVDISPKKYEVGVPTNTSISITLATDLMNAAPDTLSAAIKVRDASAGTDVQGTISYVAKVITFVPSSPLRTNTQYSIAYLDGILFDINGDGIKTAYTAYFTTATAEAPTMPVLLSPASSSLVRTVPTLTWTGNAPTHQIQIARDAAFNVVIVEAADFVGLSFTPIGLSADCQYYWRVRGTDEQADGDWSPTWTFYYGEPITPGLPPSPYAGAAPFTVVDVTPAPGATFVNDAAIRVRLSDTIDQASINNVSASKVAISEDPTALRASIAIADIKCAGDELSFRLASNIENNTEYTVTIGRQIASASGISLGEDVSWSFTGLLTPHYTTVELVRLDVGPFIGQFSDYDVSRTIHDISKWADIIAANHVSADNIHYFRCYTRYAVALRLLNRAIMDMATRQGERVRLGDFDIGKDGSLVPDINMAMKDVKLLLAECETRLRGDKNMARPGVIHKGERKYPYSQPSRAL